MKKSFFSIIIFSALVIFVLNGCAATNKKSDNKKIITDMGGVEVVIPDNIEKVVCCSNPGVDMMLALGAGDTLIGAHKSIIDNPWFDKFYPEADQLLLLDSYVPEAETLISLDADIVFLPSEENCEPLREKGICAVCLRFYSIEETKEAINLLSNIFGGNVAEKGNKWLNELDSTIAEVNDLLSNNNLNDKKSVYEILGDKYRGLYRTNYGDNQAWITYAGGDIATKEFGGATSAETPTEEAVLATNPDIVLISGIYYEQLKQDLLADNKWSAVNAVVNQEIYNVPIGCTSWSENASTYPLMIKYLFTILYPQISPYSLDENVKTFYGEYNELEFSNDEISYMLATLDPNGGSLCPPIEE